ncbi:hypothetical protein EV363DRAFT_1179741, partial [Boletus edulis]
ERRQLYLTNWLAVRPFWITRLDHSPPPQFPSPQLWRDFLHSMPPKEELEATSSSTANTKNLSKSHNLAAYEIFGEEGVALMQGSSWAPKENVEWRDKVIPIASLINSPPRLVRALLWELYEIGFRYELRALDQAMVPHLWTNHRIERVSLLYCVFPGTAGLVMWSEPLPKKSGDLGLTDTFVDNKKPEVLRSFCLLLTAWPDAHPSFHEFATAVRLHKDRKDTEVYEVMSQACFFYVQTFFDHFGRPPLLPHAFPLEYYE